jgi:hypothetical protein
MKRSLGAWVLLALLAAVPGVSAAQGSQDKTQKMSAGSAKETRWQGHIVRVNKDASTLSIRGGRSGKENFERTVAYDSSTEWTKLGKPAEMDQFKEGEFVIILGHPDEKGTLHATRVDLRTPR